MNGTRTIFIESECDKKDFKSVSLDYGELFYFNGNKCTHYNERNSEDKLRISLDFRIMLLNEYNEYIKNWDIDTVTSNPRDLLKSRDPLKMIVGGYYQMTYLNENIDSMINWFKIDKFLMQHRPTFEKEEADAVYKYMLDDTFITEHKKTEELEKVICEYIGCKHCIMTTSGTSAIILALMALNLKDNDMVIVPNYTMIATINAVKMLGLIPIIADVNKNSGTLDVSNIKKCMNDNVKCVIHVSLNNRTTELDEIVKYCRNEGIDLIEDAAQSLGCKVNNKSIGTFGKIGCFSLSTPKIISTGQGGFLITNCDHLNEQVRMLKNFGRKESGKDDFISFGINLKFTDLQAVIGLEQMKKMNYRVKRMREIYDLYYLNLKDIVEMKEINDKDWIPWFVDIYLDDREELVKYLKKHKIGSRVVYGEINKTPIYFNDNILENSNYICNNGLFLPSYITLTNNDIIHICNIIKLFKNKK